MHTPLSVFNSKKDMFPQKKYSAAKKKKKKQIDGVNLDKTL